MRAFKINTITDNQGFKLIFTDVENNKSKMWHGEFFDFEREVNQSRGAFSGEVVADSFNHALTIYQYNKDVKSLRESNTTLRNRVTKLESKILKKLRKKLKGVKDTTKINNFLR